MYILFAILIFGILIATHELGHFAAAKLCGVKVNEFSIGMGPALLKKQKGETLYSLRCLPIGGFCAMEGEDGDSDEPRALSHQAPWKRAVILIAGSLMNFITGFIIICVLYSTATAFVGNTVVETVNGFKYAENGIEAGDTVYSIDGHRVYYSSDFSTYMSRSDGTVDMTIIRNGEKITLKDYGLKPEQYADGVRYGLTFNIIEADFIQRLKFSCYSSYNFVRMVGMGLSDIFTGRASMQEMSGVVGIVDTINDVGEASPTVGAAVANIMYLAAFIAVNLAVMNMLPIPALDGGRIFFLIVTVIAEKIFRRKIDLKYEGYIHLVGLGLLLVLMAYVMFNDIVRIIR